MSALAEPPVAPPITDPAPPEPQEQEQPAPPADAKTATKYVVVAVIHQPSAGNDLPTHPAFAELRKSIVPGVPFIVGGYENPELFESTSSGDGAKRACLAAHPELAACVTAPGLSLATWPARSYGFRQVGYEQPAPVLKV